SSPGDWHLPSKDELQGIGTNPPTTWSSGYPPVTWTTPGAPFTAVQMAYWSSTEYNSTSAWFVYMANGNTDITSKNNLPNVWPVRSDN
ncbi:DUF1566 domain-containing protein, partial [bacterium]|nr:DUF1566 domain-containing protein [bacterium]